MRTSRALVGLLLVAALSACGVEDENPTVQDETPVERSGFTVTRPDGSTFELVNFVAICRDFPEGDPDAGYVEAWASLAGTRIDPNADTEPKGPAARILVLDDVPDGTQLDLPFEETYGSEETGFVFTVGDRRNTATSAEEEAAGNVEIIRASCEPTPVLEVRIDATLGSEFYDGEVLKVKGYGRLEAAKDSPSATAAASPTADTFSPEETAYLEEAQPWASSIEEPASTEGQEKLIALGQDWCRWRRSPRYGSISDEQFFGEVLIDARDGQGIAAAAEKHLCPA